MTYSFIRPIQLIKKLLRTLAGLDDIQTRQTDLAPCAEYMLNSWLMDEQSEIFHSRDGMTESESLAMFPSGS